jgi:hypothetical protein
MISVTTTTNVPSWDSWSVWQQPLMYPATHCLSKLRTDSKQDNKEKSASLLSKCNFNQHTKQCLAKKESERLNVPPPQTCFTTVYCFCLAPQLKLQIYESFTWIVQKWFWFSLSIWTWKYLSDGRWSPGQAYQTEWTWGQALMFKSRPFVPPEVSSLFSLCCITVRCSTPLAQLLIEELSCGTVVCKHFASYQDYPNYRWDLIR